MECLLFSKTSVFDTTILGLAETKLEEGEIIKLEGYEIERVDREEEGGGSIDC